MDESNAVTPSAATELEVDGSDASAEGVDYEAALSLALEAQERAEGERDNYKQGLLKAKGKLPKDETDIESAVARALEKALPKLQAAITPDAVETWLDKNTSTPAERKLIKFYYENGNAGTLNEQLENAKLIANKKALLRQTSELRTALQNRASMGMTSGSHSEGPTVKDNYFSADQVAELRKKGWDDKKIEMLKKNLQKKQK